MAPKIEVVKVHQLSFLSIFLLSLFVILVCTLIVATVIIYPRLFTRNPSQTNLDQTSKPNPSSSYTPAAAHLYQKSDKIFYVASSNPDGRGVFYQSAGLTQAHFPGLGVYNLPLGTKVSGGENASFTVSRNDIIQYITGIFSSWENIPGSSDKYLVFAPSDVTNATTPSSLTKFPKIRVIFSLPSSIKPAMGTNLGVEDLDFVLTNSSTTPDTLYSFAPIGGVSSKTLNQVLLPGDAVIVTITKDFAKQQDLADSSGFKIADWVYIRRFEPNSSLGNDLGIIVHLHQR